MPDYFLVPQYKGAVIKISAKKGQIKNRPKAINFIVGQRGVGRSTYTPMISGDYIRWHTRLPEIDPVIPIQNLSSIQLTVFNDSDTDEQVRVMDVACREKINFGNPSGITILCREETYADFLKYYSGKVIEKLIFHASENYAPYLLQCTQNQETGLTHTNSLSMNRSSHEYNPRIFESLPYQFSLGSGNCILGSMPPHSQLTINLYYR